MIDRPALLSDLQALLKRLEADLLDRSESADVPEVGRTLRAEFEKARAAERTAENYEDWRSAAITQTAAAWALAGVFVRFLEDNRLIDPPKFAGPTGEEHKGVNDRLARARDEHEDYFRKHPTETDREYLLAVFDHLAGLRGTRDVFGPHNPLRELPHWLSGDAAGELLRFFQKIDANTGRLIHDFTDAPTDESPGWDTRFLGDLYQDLSEAARKRYALLQTPEFVEEFILDRTLEPALETFGLEPAGGGGPFRLIDPACGSGHFLLGAFRRLLDRWQRRQPGALARDLVQRALTSVHGVDVNPFAVAIARFRLLLAAMRASGVTRLADCPDFAIRLACGDSLLHAPLRASASESQHVFGWENTATDAECDHAYQSEDLPLLKEILRLGRYHAVVANPPYIVPKDSQLGTRYRKRFAACHRQYSLGVPFTEMLFRLAVPGGPARGRDGAAGGGGATRGPAGFVGQITANSFMKREFGKKLIESFLPTIDLTHVIDTSGAYIPGHGTPTVILFGQRRPPVAGTIRAALGIRGEPSTPADPARGRVWSAIVEQLDHPGSQSDFVSVTDSERDRFHAHPWSIGGGGAAELKERLEEKAGRTLGDVVDEIGRTTHTGEDDAFYLEPSALGSRRLRTVAVPVVTGEDVRDFRVMPLLQSLFPYDRLTGEPLAALTVELERHFWAYKTLLRCRRDYGQCIEERGLRWFDHSMFFPKRYRTPLSIAFAFVATHNHFVLDRGGKVFNRSAPVIKLSPEASEDDHFALLTLLNSSTACFWMKQVFYPKGGDHVGQEGARVRRTLWDERYEFAGTGLLSFPVPSTRSLTRSRHLDGLAEQIASLSPEFVIAKWQAESEHAPISSLRECLADAALATVAIQDEMRRVQEDLDWECYRLYGLIDEELTAPPADGDEGRGIPPGARAFELLLARRAAAGEVATTWFERHGITPLVELPADVPAAYRDVVLRRLEAIRDRPEIALIEQPEYKRRWNWEPWPSRQERALRDWLLARLEGYFDFDGRMGGGGASEGGGGAESAGPLREVALYSCAEIADAARRDPLFLEVGQVYRDDAAFDVERLVSELVRAESVPLLPALRYKPSGLRKRAEWEHTWELQRAEDRGALPPGRAIPVPPKYTSADFLSTGGARYWALRGKLDVPKERWVSFPHCEGPDGTLRVAWAGYDHLQLARAVSAWYVDVQDRLGGREDPRLIPLLAALAELVPWLKQWHNDHDPDYGTGLGDYFEGFLQEEARTLPRPAGGTGWTLEELRAWEPAKKAGGRGSRKTPS